MLSPYRGATALARVRQPQRGVLADTDTDTGTKIDTHFEVSR
ncbi:hypothetical protein QS306_16735 [Paraburkholderia bonniea]|nr:hypothetical protein [Paraburkholderia bonniea]WJF91717.1 hypothetical protein QS306_16735 [Paraburkholderia bonniea]WJF95037.1 hypothetical protein QS308_16740 [Paraburkholderia bonniea]